MQALAAKLRGRSSSSQQESDGNGIQVDTAVACDRIQHPHVVSNHTFLLEGTPLPVLFSLPAAFDAARSSDQCPQTSGRDLCAPQSSAFEVAHDVVVKFEMC